MSQKPTTTKPESGGAKIVIPNRRPPVAVIGFGTTGTATAATFAKQGMHVYCYDKDKAKIEQLRKAVSPVNEPALRDAVKELRETNRLVVTDSLRAALDAGEIVFLCVGSSDEAIGKVDFSALRRACVEIGQLIATPNPPFTLVIRTPLYPGIYNDIIAPAFKSTPNLGVVLNPPVLRQGESLQDMLQSRVNVVGSNNLDAARKVAELYYLGKLPADVTSLALAEFFGQVSGAFQALKVTFANEVSALCNGLGVSPIEMLELLSKDSLLTTSSAFLKPGLSFGGLDLVRETTNLAAQAEKSGATAPLIRSIAPSNQEHFDRVVRDLERLGVQRFGIYGLSVRSNTDEIRASTAVTLSEALLGKKHDVRLFDPSIQFERLHGSNWRNLLYHLPLAERLLTPNLDELLKWAQYLVVVHQPNRLQADQIINSRIPVVNLSGVPLAA